jgi:integrase/recombinase XerD
MSTLAAAAADYLRMRRALGYKLDRQGRQLLQFVAYLDQFGASTITTEHAVAWATQPPGGECSYWTDRLSVVRQFARYLQTIDPACEVPPKHLLPYRRQRPVPYIYTAQQIEELMLAAQDLRGELHRATMQTLIGLMAVTGMRIGEAIGLDRDDVDARHQLLRVIDGKFGKSRELALHASTLVALDDYAKLRDRLCPSPGCEAFFISRNGTRLLSQCVHFVFARIVKIVGLEPGNGRRRPRPHDLRHSFAVSTLLNWYADDTTSVQAQLPSLSTYMGHVEPANTYYYLTATPELLARAASRLEPTLKGL